MGINSNISVWHRAFDCFPDLNGKHADHFSSAAISVWIRVQDGTAPAEHADKISSELRSEGWLVASELTDWSKKLRDNNEFVDQAILDGFVARVHRVETEHVLLFSDSKAATSMTEQLYGFIEKVAGTGLMYSLYSEKHDQYANGVAPSGQEFVPLWSSKEVIANWMLDYPSYQITEINLKTVKSLILPELNSETMSVAMGCGDDELILVHPILFMHQLPKIH